MAAPGESCDWNRAVNAIETAWNAAVNATGAAVPSPRWRNLSDQVLSVEYRLDLVQWSEAKSNCLGRMTIEVAIWDLTADKIPWCTKLFSSRWEVTHRPGIKSTTKIQNSTKPSGIWSINPQTWLRILRRDTGNWRDEGVTCMWRDRRIPPPHWLLSLSLSLQLGLDMGKHSTHYSQPTPTQSAG